MSRRPPTTKRIAALRLSCSVSNLSNQTTGSRGPRTQCRPLRPVPGRIPHVFAEWPGLTRSLRPLLAYCLMGSSILYRSRPSPVGLGHDERLVHQPREQVQDLPLFDAFSGAHRLRRLQGPPAREDREPPEQLPLGFAQELVAPVQRRPERPLPRGPPAARGGKPRGSLRAARQICSTAAAPSAPRPALWPAGMPSSLSQIRATAGAFCGVSAKAAAAVSRPALRTAAPTRTFQLLRHRSPPGVRHGERGTPAGRPRPHTPKGFPAGGQDPQVRAGVEEDIHEPRTWPQRSARSCPTRARPASRRAPASVSVSGRPGCSRTPKAPATAWGTSSPPRGAPAPPATPRQGRLPRGSLATSRASRVLPEPPVPVRVSSRVMASSRFTSTISRSRPTKLVLGAGRLCLPRRAGSLSRGAPVSRG